MFLFYLRVKSRRGDGNHVLRAQVLRAVGNFCTVKMDCVRPGSMGKQFEHVTP